MILPTQGLCEYWQQGYADMNSSEKCLILFILLQGGQKAGMNHEADRALNSDRWASSTSLCRQLAR